MRRNDATRGRAGGPRLSAPRRRDAPKRPRTPHGQEKSRRPPTSTETSSRTTTSGCESGRTRKSGRTWRAENKYADEFMKGTEALQEKLYDEMLGRIKQTDLTVP